MTNKDKERIQELKQIAWILLIGAILATSLIAYSTGKATNLEQGLQDCQENVDVWNLKVECDWGNGNWRIIWEENFTDYDMYKYRLDFFIDDKECEVIK